MLESYRRNVNFIKKYAKALNASSGSEVDSNANVENKNITTCMGELPKREIIGTNRLLMHDKLTELYGVELANEYIRQLNDHEIYKHDETSILPYCVSITMYPFLFNGLTDIGGISTAPTNLQAFQGSFINLVFAIASQFAGAVATPEYLMYLDYFIRKEYGNDYYKHVEDIVVKSIKPKTIDKVITDGFEQVVYSMNQPASARNFQSVFWNIAYFDKPYFDGMFSEFVFPDLTSPTWDSVNWLQKRFMKWFNRERLKTILTFPVETMNLLNDGKEYVDKEYRDFQAEMYAEGHSFFTYTSNSVDSLASCCFDGNQKVLTKSSNGVSLLSFKELYDSKYEDTKRNFTVYHNGSWAKGKTIRLDGRQEYKIVTVNNKEIVVTDNHINPTLEGNKKTTELSTNDYLLFNNLQLDTFPEKNEKLTYEQGMLIGMYLGDGSIYEKENCDSIQTSLSLCKEKYERSIDILNKASSQLNSIHDWKLSTQYNNVYPLFTSSKEVATFIRKYVSGKYSQEKELNLTCLLQSSDFRKGILEGYYLTDGGNSNRIYTTSKNLVEQIEVLISSLGMNSIIDISDRTDEKVIIRGEEFNRNYPLYCIRYYSNGNKRSMGDVFKIFNNSIYFKIKSIEKIEEIPKYVYCFEMENEDEPYFTLPNGIITHNCRLKNELQDNTFSYTLGAGGVSTGSKGVVTINLNRLVQTATKNNIDISVAIREQVKKVHKYLIAYNDIITDYFNARMLPIFDAGYISLEKQFLTIGINGFVEGAESLGIEISPNDEYFEYGEKILKPIYDLNKSMKTKDLMFNTEFVPAENLGVKNSKWDKEDGYFVPRECYNSYFYIVEDESCNILDKFILHGNKLTRYLDGGSALHMNLDEHLSKEQYIKLGEVAIKTGSQYYTYNVPNTICNDCGYISKHRLDKCEKCGSDNLDYATRIIGYLKRVSKFAEARIKEAKVRFYGKFTS
jgi:anaerobic ribonucleoside-triphosphate reductase